MSDERDRMLEVIWREKRPEIPILPDKTMPMYDIAEIYDHPAQYSTVRGIFTYTGVEII